MDLYKNKYLQQQFQLNQQQQQQNRQQKQNQQQNNNFINLDGTSLQLASKLRQIKENLEKNCVTKQPQQQEFFDYQKSQFNFNNNNNDNFSDVNSEDANSTLVSDSINKNNNNNKMFNKQGNDSFSSSTTLSSLLVSKINNNKSILVTPPDSLILNAENAAQVRKKYQIEKQYSIYSEDSLYKPQKQQQQQQAQLPVQNLQEGSYSDNISRQSSIRSLISLDKKVNEMAARKQMIQQKFLNQPSKFHSIQAETNSNSSQFDDNERLLLLNWENYDDIMSQSSVSTVTSNQEPRKRVNNKFISVNEYQKQHEVKTNDGSRRPETRLGFRHGDFDDDDDNTSIHDTRNNFVESNADTESIFTTESIIIDNTIDKNVGEIKFRPTRSINARDSERRRTTSDLVIKNNENNIKNHRYIGTNIPEYQQQQPRNAISDLNVANFEMNLNEMKFKQNNFFNGIFGDQQQQQQQQDGDIKYKRYQALSASINKIFTDLFENFEKNKSSDGNLLQIKNNNNQLNDSHSNKDSGFIQEYNSPQQSKPNSSSNTSQNQLKQQQQQQSVKPKSMTSVSNNTATGNASKDISLLERYLNSEQQISFKYRQIINILERAYCENGYLIEDYSLAEYILNQEGISFQTFQQSIREKYPDFEWHEYLLAQLYQSINNNNNTINNNESLVQHINNDSYQPSPTSSQASKSFRKVKDIKYASQQKRNSKFIVQQQQQSQQIDDLDDSLNESLNNREKQQFDNQNTSLVESCGILMKTNGWRKEIEDYFETQSVSKQKDTRRGRKGSLPEAKLNYMVPAKLTSSNNQSKDEDLSSYQTQKHQNAFILEILRTSMFRSKSASDLRNSSTRSSNKSLNKIDIGPLNSSNSHHMSYDSEAENENIDKLCNYYKHSENCTKCLKLTNEQIDSHRGVIWQCADMCYSEFTHRYEELLWLLDGGNFSIQSKLRVSLIYVYKKPDQSGIRGRIRTFVLLLLTVF
jgi:hypothetical protein